MKTILLNKEALRKFSATVGIFFSILGTLLLLKHKGAYLYYYTASLGFLITGLLAPLWLKPVYKVWMKLGSVATRAVVSSATGGP